MWNNLRNRWGSLSQTRKVFTLAAAIVLCIVAIPTLWGWVGNFVGHDGSKRGPIPGFEPAKPELAETIPPPRQPVPAIKLPEAPAAAKPPVVPVVPPLQVPATAAAATAPPSVAPVMLPPENAASLNLPAPQPSVPIASPPALLPGANSVPTPQLVPPTPAPPSVVYSPQIIVYCGGKPCESAVPKAVKPRTKVRPPAAATSAPMPQTQVPVQTEPPPLAATRAPCPSGNCSDSAWNPNDPRQPRPGEVSARQY